MKIGYIAQLGNAYETINGTSIDSTLIHELQKKHDITLLHVNNLTKKSILAKYDYIFLGFNIWKLYLENSYNEVYKRISNVKTLSVPKQLIYLVANKCALYDYLVTHNIPIIPTLCINVRTLNQSKIDSKYKDIQSNNGVFLKPNPGLQSINVRRYTHGNNLSTYIRVLKNKDYNNVIMQPYIKSFATRRNPEIRTLWIGHNLSHAVHTVGTGNVIKTTNRIPKTLNILSLHIIKTFEHDFSFNFAYVRLDYGKYNGKYVLNEIEIFPGVFPEGNPLFIKQLSNHIGKISQKKNNLLL